MTVNQWARWTFWFSALLFLAAFSLIASASLLSGPDEPTYELLNDAAAYALRMSMSTLGLAALVGLAALARRNYYT